MAAKFPQTFLYNRYFLSPRLLLASTWIRVHLIEGGGNVFLQNIRTWCENPHKTTISTKRIVFLVVNVWERNMFPFLFFCSTDNVTFSASVNFWMQMLWTHWRALKQTSSSCQYLSGSCAAVLQHITSPVILNCKKSAGRLTCYEMTVWADSSWRSTWEWMWVETQLLSACKINTTWHSSVTFNLHSHDKCIWQICQ